MTAEPRKKLLRDRWLRNFLPVAVFDRVRMTQYSSPGTVMVIAVTIATVFLWAFFAWGDGLPWLVVLTKIAAFSAVALLAVNHVLSIRSRFLERLFRGLDRMYRVHHLVGQVAFLLIIAHPILLVAARWDDRSAVLDILLPARDFGITLGMVSAYLLLALLFVTISLKVRYHIWHISHHIMVLPLFFAFLHAVESGTYMNRHMYLRLWIIVVCAIGLSAYVYTMLIYRHVGPTRKGSVVEVKDMGSITEISFRLRGPPLSFRAGQFVFIRFLSLPQDYEAFPFSLSGAPGKEILRISAKKTGDFTTHVLPTLKKGDAVVTWGPYGAFGEHYHHRQDDSVWIAGGIGVTPFLSMMQEEKRNRRRRILFVWVCNRQEDAVYDPEIRSCLQDSENIRYILWTSKNMGRITASKMLEMVDEDVKLKRLDVFLCGPPPMMSALSHQLLDEGFHGNQIFFEDFSLL